MSKRQGKEARLEEVGGRRGKFGHGEERPRRTPRHNGEWTRDCQEDEKLKIATDPHWMLWTFVCGRTKINRTTERWITSTGVSAGRRIQAWCGPSQQPDAGGGLSERSPVRARRRSRRWQRRVGQHHFARPASVAMAGQRGTPGGYSTCSLRP
ncbi:hypothetical protein GN956_G7853 [Arapaima gigas]